MKKIIDIKIRKLRLILKNFYFQRKDQFLVFTFLAVLLIYLRVNPLFPYYLTDRKIFFIVWILFFVVFKVSSQVVGGIGLAFLVLVSLSALLGYMGVVSKLVVYAWGFLLLGVLMQTFELTGEKNEKNNRQKR